MARASLRNPSLLVGAALVLLLVAAAILAPLIASHAPDTIDLRAELQPPSWAHWFGTDRFGRDIFSRIVWGARISLVVGIVSATSAVVLGSIPGVLAGFYRGWLDELLMRTLDVPLAFPYILLAIVIVATLGPGLNNSMIAIVIVGIPYFARVARSATLSVRNLLFIDAARMAGESDLRILASDVLPNIAPPLLVTYTIYIGWMILQTASLSFLGLGAQPPTPEWGAMLAESRELIQIAPHTALAPGLAVVIAVLGLNLLGEGIRDLIDPRLVGGR